MAEICSVCGLPKDLCVCGTISMEQQVIRIRTESRRWGKPMTIIEGIDPKSVDLKEIAAKLKSICACGGTVKNATIMLQGDHREKVREMLAKLGFPQSSIEVH
ncbi:MAG: stress response translation initiation inhibitor YciH [Candidatus Bathyarchaeia archaeon]